MLSNRNSRIDPMASPPMTESRKRSINLFTAVEIEVDALSFEMIGVSTRNPKDVACIVSALYSDTTSCSGEIRAAYSLTTSQISRPVLYIEVS